MFRRCLQCLSGVRGVVANVATRELVTRNGPTFIHEYTLAHSPTTVYSLKWQNSSQPQFSAGETIAFDTRVENTTSKKTGRSYQSLVIVPETLSKSSGAAQPAAPAAPAAPASRPWTPAFRGSAAPQPTKSFTNPRETTRARGVEISLKILSVQVEYLDILSRGSGGGRGAQDTRLPSNSSLDASQPPKDTDSLKTFNGMVSAVLQGAQKYEEFVTSGKLPQKQPSQEPVAAASEAATTNVNKEAKP